MTARQPSKFGKDIPLSGWKTATTCFLRIVTECVAALLTLGEGSFFFLVSGMYSLRDLYQRYRTHEFDRSYLEVDYRRLPRRDPCRLVCGTFVILALFVKLGRNGFCSSTAENFDLEDQEAEENYDLALISSLEIDLVPHLGGPRVPDNLIGQLSKVLHQGSQLYKFPFHTPRSGSPGLREWNNMGSSPNSRE
jgi:hypothetical protein